MSLKNAKAAQAARNIGILTGLLKKIKSRKFRAGVIGLGYVGLPLCVSFARRGVQVMGFDIDEQKIRKIKAGKSYIGDVPSADVAACVRRGTLDATHDFSKLAKMDTVNICVPTPLRKSKDPDISFVLSAVQQIAKYARPGQLIILESTTYPGTTVELLQPALQDAGLKVGETVFIAFSPERVDPANKKFTIENTPKVVGGITPACTRAACAFYSTAIQKVIPVSSPTVAEMVKLLENTFRGINIGLANEMAQLCHKMGVDVWEVIDAASTKPFGFMPFYPGPGLGGHCIPVDPLYLAWKVRLFNLSARFIELATDINSKMPEYVVERIMQALNDEGKAVRGSRVHILGVTYKRDVADVRESPAIEIIDQLEKLGAELHISDPMVNKIACTHRSYDTEPVTSSALNRSDIVVLVTDHTQFDYSVIGRESRKIFDTRDAFRKKKVKVDKSRLIRL